MQIQEPPQLSSKIKGWRVARYFLFAMIYAFIQVAILQIPAIARLAQLAHENDLVAVAAALAMTFVLMIAILIGGMRFTDLTAEWKPQLLGVFAFLWSIDTCRTIGYVFARYFSPGIESEDVLFLYFFAGLIALLPFEFIAARAYYKRLGIPIWPNLPKR
jgi:hypothetical protein